MGKLLLNESALSRDLNNCWAVVAEGIQTVLRREGYPKPYEALKALTRTNQTVTEQSIKEFIETLNVSDRIKDELRAITPHNFRRGFVFRQDLRKASHFIAVRLPSS